jgi:glycolate oxidase
MTGPASQLKADIMSNAEVLAALAPALAPDALIVDRDVTRSLSHDDAEWAPCGEPLAVIRATSSDQVAAVVRICARFGVPVTARGAGTGLSGGANAIEGGVIIALDRLNEIRLIDPLERLAVVQAGVINDELRAAAAEQGLWYPPDPQHRDERRRCVLCQVRRDQGLRARP